MNDIELEEFRQTLQRIILQDDIERRIINIRVRDVYDALVEVDDRDIDLYEDARKALFEYERLYSRHVINHIEIENLDQKITDIVTRIRKNKVSKFPPHYKKISSPAFSLWLRVLLIESQRITANIKSIKNILSNNPNIISVVASEHLLPILTFQDTWTDHLLLLLNYIKGKSIFTKKLIIELQDENVWENRLENSKKLLLQGPSITPTITPTPFYSQSYQLVKTPKHTPMPSVPYKVSIQGVPKESVEITNEILAKGMELFKTSIIDTVGVIGSGISFGFTNLLLPYTPGEEKIIAKDIERIDATVNDISDCIHRAAFKTTLLCAFYIFFYVLWTIIYYSYRQIKATRRRRSRRLTANFSFKHHSRKASSRKASSRKASSRKASSRKVSSRKVSSRKVSSRKVSSRKVSSRKVSSRKVSNRINK